MDDDEAPVDDPIPSSSELADLVSADEALERTARERSEFVRRIAWALLFPEDDDTAEAQEISVPLWFAGRDVGKCTISPRALFDAMGGDEAHNLHKNADLVAELSAKLLFDRAFDESLAEMQWNEAIDDWLTGQERHERLCELLSHWEIGRKVLRLASVQFLLRYAVSRPDDVTAVSKAFERGLRSKVAYFKKKAGRRRVSADPATLAEARAYVRKVQAAARAAKKHPSRLARRKALENVLRQFLTDSDSPERLAVEWLELSPSEIAKNVASIRFSLAKRRL